MTERKPTMIADCGCPYDPEYDEGSLGWHQSENHIPETIRSLKGTVARLAEELARLESDLMHPNRHLRREVKPSR